MFCGLIYDKLIIIEYKSIFILIRVFILLRCIYMLGISMYVRVKVIYYYCFRWRLKKV